MKKNSMSAKMRQKFRSRNSSNSCIYFLGTIGASIHYLSLVTSFGSGVTGVLKVIVWPVVLVYKAFQFLA